MRRKLFSVILAAVMLFGGTQPAAAVTQKAKQNSGYTLQEVKAALAAENTDSTDSLYPLRQGTSLTDITVTSFDTDGFNADLETFKQYGDANDTEGIVSMYDTLYSLLTDGWTMYAAAELMWYEDINDDAMNEQANQLYTDVYAADTAFFEACSYVMQSAGRTALRKHVGTEKAAYYASYTPESDEEYAAASLTVMDLESEYYQVYDELITGKHTAQEYAEAAAPIYAQLIRQNTALAQLYGYDSYADYAYAWVYGRDYTPDDAQTFCDAVKPLAQQYFADLFYADPWYQTNRVRSLSDDDAVLTALGDAVHAVVPQLDNICDFLTEYNLCDIGNESGRYNISYTGELYSYNEPFIFMYSDGGFDAFNTLSHEFGHFCNNYIQPTEDVLFGTVDSYDIMEIHSNGMQVLLTAAYDDIFTAGADIAEFQCLGDMMENIIDGCIYDEFQRRIWAEDDLSAENINRVYIEVCSEYGKYTDGTPEWDSDWVDVTHNFDDPFYYISYAASALAALQLWDAQQSDPDTAAEMYLQLLNVDMSALGYQQALQECGLRLFTDDGAVDAICTPVMDRMYELIR